SPVQQFNNDAASFSVVAGPDQPTWALIDGKIQTRAKVRTDRTWTIWIDATIDQIRIRPDSAPCEFRLSRIELLVPAAQATPWPAFPAVRIFDYCRDIS